MMCSRSRSASNAHARVRIGGDVLRADDLPERLQASGVHFQGRVEGELLHPGPPRLGEIRVGHPEGFL
jgi:hypothetical protein